MTIEEAREYWSRRLERAEGYSDEHWDAEERHAHKEYIDALKHAVTALAICREREEAENHPETNGDRIRNMPDEELAESLSGSVPCRYVTSCLNISCYECTLRWLKQEIDANDECCDCQLNDITNECTDVQTRLEWLKQEVSGYAAERTD